VKAWYEQPTCPRPSAQNGSARGGCKVLTDYEIMRFEFQPLMFTVPAVKKKAEKEDRRKAAVYLEDSPSALTV